MKLSKRVSSLLTVLGVALQVGCSSGSSPSNKAADMPATAATATVGNIIEVAEKAGSFSTLLTAIRAAGLEETVRNAPALTVFAPTDAAFEALPEGALDQLVADQEALEKVLLYHVVDGAVPSSTAITLSEASMLSGDKTSIRYDGTTLFINEAKVIAADVQASNGVIHVIDKVLLPTAAKAEGLVDTPMDLISTAEAAGGFSTLLAAVKAAGLEETLRTATDVTLFAPNDAAFAKIPADTLNRLLADKEALTNVLLYHVVGARVSAAAASQLTEATMLNGSKVEISSCNGGLTINGAKVLAADIDGGNGVIHVIDTVLIP